MQDFEPDFKIVFAGKDITTDVSEDMISLSYSDFIDGQSDECSVTFCNIDGKWFDDWYPNKGDALQISLGYKNQLVEYSKCEIESIEFKRFPDEVTITALSTGIKKAVRTRKSKAFDGRTLRSIAEEVGKAHDLKVVGDIKDITIQRATQYQETDVGFLLRLSKTYGYTFKIVDEQLVFTSLDEIKKGDVSRVLSYEDMLEFSIIDKIKDVAKEAEVRKQDVKKKTVAKKRVLAEGETSYDMKVINVSYGSEAEGQAKAKAALDEENEDKTVAEVTVVGDPMLVAGSVITLTDIGKLSGDYYINESRHEFDSSEGYKTALTIKSIVARKGVKSTGQSKAKPKSNGSYTTVVVPVKE